MLHISDLYECTVTQKTCLSPVMCCECDLQICNSQPLSVISLTCAGDCHEWALYGDDDSVLEWKLDGTSISPKFLEAKLEGEFKQIKEDLYDELRFALAKVNTFKSTEAYIRYLSAIDSDEGGLPLTRIRAEERDDAKRVDIYSNSYFKNYPYHYAF